MVTTTVSFGGDATPIRSSGTWDPRTNEVSYRRARYESRNTADNGQVGQAAQQVAEQVDRATNPRKTASRAPRPR
jgi:hypothetical protein